MKSPCCNADVYYEVWFCEKNPDGLLDGAAMPHGNEINGTTTCEDDYCRPDTKAIDDPSDEYMKTHEGVERCTKCHNMTEGMQ